MRRFSFGTFLVDDGNHALYETCRSIAALSYRGRLPVLLVAPEGHGKTHLLYSIVNRARSGPARTGVAFVSADEFPAEVRRLTRNPGPVERARNAILLVDDLHRFRHHLDELDRLVDLFLKHGHYVVLTSETPLDSLNHLPAPLARRLARGHAVRSETVAEPPPTAQSAEPDPAENAELEHLRGQWQTTQQELEKAQQELEQLRGENALLKVSAREVGPLRERLEALQDQLEHAQPEPAPRTESPARQQAGAVLEKAAALLQEVQQSRSRLAQMREQSRVFEAKPATAEETGDAPAGAPDPPPAPAGTDSSALDEALAERDRLREERERLEREVETLRRSVARANEERDETRRHLRAAFEKLDRYEKNLTELRAQIDHYSTETESAADEMDDEQAEAARLEAATVAEELRTVQAQFASGLRMIDRMADRLDALCASLGGPEVPESNEAEPFFVTPVEEKKPAATPDLEDGSGGAVEPAFVPGIVPRPPDKVAAAPVAHLRPAEGDWTPRRSLHHIEELAEPGLFSYPDDHDSSI